MEISGRRGSGWIDAASGALWRAPDDKHFDASRSAHPLLSDLLNRVLPPVANDWLGLAATPGLAAIFGQPGEFRPRRRILS
jgi:hypothetical protein